MKLTALDIHNFMRVECVSMSFSPTGAITIGGDNGSGKTSVQTFLELCFGGRDKCPPLPVKVGAKKSMGRVTLDDEGHCVTIDVEIGEDRAVKATVRQDGGKAFDGPITMLRKLVSRFTFSPAELIKLTGQEQRKTMLDCLGVDFGDLEARAEKIKEERKEVGRDRNGRERQIASMPMHAGVPETEISMASVAGELQKALAHNQRCREFTEAAEEWTEEMAKAGAEVKALEASLVKARARLEEAMAGKKSADAAAAKLTPIDASPIKQRLADADAINAKVRANQARAKLVAQFQNDHDDYKELGEDLEGIERAKQDRLNAAQCPVKGLEFRDDGVWYQGLPLAQDMESDQMLRAVQLAAALNPKLRAIFLDNAERILPAKMAELDAWAVANDYQVLTFRAASSDAGCEFFLQDGKVMP